MTDATRITAQVVMRREDGRSILDLEGPMRAASPDRAAGDLPESRIAEIRTRLEAEGFTVEGGNANTLSVTGPAEAFAACFGLGPEAGGGAGLPPADHARIRRDLAPFVADVVVPPTPQFFP